MFHKFFIIILFTFIETTIAKHEVKRDQSINGPKVFATCMENLGCIDTNEKWFDTYNRPVNLEPLDRHTIRTEFLLMKHSKNNSKEVLYDILTLKKETVIISGFEKDKITTFLIHDFTSNGHTGWIKHIALAITEEVDVNVISVDWEAGAEPPYDQAIANARVVALEMQAFIKMLKTHFSLKEEHIHIIGHGVGAHIAGYVGKDIRGISKITALDPSGPRFENMPSLVRLDPDDAKYVEVLHTDAFNSRSQGTLQPMGHSDFYINNAGLQPGCNDSYNHPRFTEITRSLLREGKILPACSHKRSFKYYISAITTRECKFVGIACSSYQAFLNGSCSDCERSVCSTFDMCPAPKHIEKLTKFYLNTNSDTPYCMHGYQVNVSIEQHPNAKKTEGYLEFILIDTNNKITFATASIFGNAKRTFIPGFTYTLIIYAPPPAITNMKEAKVRWICTASFFFKRSIFVKYVSIKRIPMVPEELPVNGMCPETGTEIKDGAYIQFVYCNVKKIQEEERLAALSTTVTVLTTINLPTCSINNTNSTSGPSNTTSGPSNTTSGPSSIAGLPNTTLEPGGTTIKPPLQCLNSEEKTTITEGANTTTTSEKSEEETIVSIAGPNKEIERIEGIQGIEGIEGKTELQVGKAIGEEKEEITILLTTTNKEEESITKIDITETKKNEGEESSGTEFLTIAATNNVEENLKEEIETTLATLASSEENKGIISTLSEGEGNVPSTFTIENLEETVKEVTILITSVPFEVSEEIISTSLKSEQEEESLLTSTTVGSHAISEEEEKQVLITESSSAVADTPIITEEEITTKVTATVFEEEKEVSTISEGSVEKGSEEQLTTKLFVTEATFLKEEETEISIITEASVEKESEVLSTTKLSISEETEPPKIKPTTSETTSLKEATEELSTSTSETTTLKEIVEELSTTKSTTSELEEETEELFTSTSGTIVMKEDIGELPKTELSTSKKTTLKEKTKEVFTSTSGTIAMIEDIGEESTIKLSTSETTTLKEKPEKVSRTTSEITSLKEKTEKLSKTTSKATTLKKKIEKGTTTKLSTSKTTTSKKETKPSTTESPTTKETVPTKKSEKEGTSPKSTKESTTNTTEELPECDDVEE